MTALQHPKAIQIVGPAAGFTVSLTGASVYADSSGTAVAMPHTPHIWQHGDADVGGGVIVTGDDAGIVSYAIDHPHGASLHMRCVVSAPDGTILIDRTFATAPVLIDALARTVEPLLSGSAGIEL